MPTTQKKRVPIKTREWVFEVAWEVCNKVGGIYTVIVSKASKMQQHYKNYFLVGPYFSDQVKGEFIEKDSPKNFKRVFAELEEEGIECHFGEWLIEGKPKAILIDFKKFLPRINEIKAQLWEAFRIDSLETGNDFNEPVVWSFAAGRLIEKISKGNKTAKIIAHFHEWLSGTGLLYLKKFSKKIGTVFTTHATVLGRTLAFREINFYPFINGINAENEAAKFGVKAKHQLEKAVAKNSDIFSTVSIITGIESGVFLERDPDIIVGNGLDTEKLPSFEDLVIKHRVQRDRLREFVLSYFFPYYTFDPEETLFYFISGRYELKAKGIDVFIKALSALNQKLIQERSEKTIITFLLIPSYIKGVRPDVLENKQLFEDIKDSLEEISEETKRKILYSLAEGKKLETETLFNEKFLFEVKKKILKSKKEDLPPLSTHVIDENDRVISLLKENKLDNRKENKVKVIFYPTYLNGYDGLSNLNYQEMVLACHLGLFPSFYEPWGYTPLETAAVGVASMTTDMAGFGQFLKNIKGNKKNPGIFILERFGKEEKAIVKSLAEIMHRFSCYSKKQRIENKINAKKISAFADWKILAKNYFKAHELALKKVKNRK